MSDGAQNAGQAAQNAGHAIGTAAGKAAGKAKVPAAAGGAALAGLVGGMAIATRGGGKRRVLGVPVPGTRRPLVKITRKADTKQLVRTAGQMAQIANEVRLAREQGVTSRRRSPIEVVLEGLTARRGHTS